MSFLQYSITFWGQTYESYREAIFKQQRKAIRIIPNQTSRSNSLPLFKDLQLLRLSDIFKFKLLTFVYESTKLLTSRCFHGYFSFNSAIHNYTTKQCYRGDLYLIGKNTLRYGLGSIRYMGAKLWNELSREVRNSSSKFLFRKNLKKHLHTTMWISCFLCFNAREKLL